MQKFIFLLIGMLLINSEVCYAISDTDMSNSAILQRIEPVGKATIETPQTTQDTKTQPTTTTSIPNTGEKIYKTYCVACHDSGVAGAPKLGDVVAWQPRIAQGMPTLIQHAIQGYKMMPPKGACLNCSDKDIEAAVKYMVSTVQNKK